ncbi:hypothetical protein IHE26_08945 [Plesiomonas shigelloides]|uniref:hypothetical protein n=1 Tax=Plesiomonas shigelloides TaxID=703 RepID=UPI00177B3091|nr:hypothetical protein [Plesiomonas shigelloides]QOH78581.1 hypothetical protein IHE26_08945 [Plesiomonas shigelloides]
MKFLNKNNIMWTCLLVLVYLITHGIVNNEIVINYYKGSLIPEFTGMFLELLIILIVFNTWQERIENQKKIDKERVLRKYIIFTINQLRVFESIPTSFSFYGENHNENHATLNSLRDEVKALSETDVYNKVGDSFIKHCKTDIDAITALLPVAADLSKEHFKTWSRVVFYVKKLSFDDVKKEDIKEYIVNLIEYIRDFDDASFKNKIYDDAK